MQAWRDRARRWSSRLGGALVAGLTADLRRQHTEQASQLKTLETQLATAVEQAAAASVRAAAAQRTTGPSLPTSSGQILDLPEPAHEASDIPADSTIELSACPVCDGEASTLVSEFNKLLLLETAVDESAKRYDYALCHRCGVVSARVRPTGRRYTYLLNRFEMTLGRIAEGEAVPSHRTGSSVALTEDQRRTFRERISAGVFVSDHLDLAEEQYLENLFHDRVNTARHVEIIGSLVPLHNPRVLELRPKLGAISHALKRLYNADVYTMPLFEVAQFIIEETYGIPATHRLDYDNFSIPYDGDFDLVVANHLLTHAVHPRAMLGTIRDRLRPGGHVYFYNEITDHIDRKTTLFHSLNAFHLQIYDVSSLVRTLAEGGFETVVVKREGSQLLILARRSESRVPYDDVPEDKRLARLAQYQRARDLAILKLPDHLRGRFAHEWDAVVERAVSAGLAAFDKHGDLRLVRHPG